VSEASRDPAAAVTPPSARPALVGRAIALEGVTIAWALVECVLGIVAAVAAGSVALFGFGLDSAIEAVSGGIVLWRLLAERRGAPHATVERMDRLAHRTVGVLLLALALYVAGDAIVTLVRHDRPGASALGIAVTAVALVAMLWLAQAKRRVAIALGSGALAADAVQTSACWWLSLATLAGVGLNTAFGWWWADPAAALVMTGLIAWEAREALSGRSCAC